MFLDYSQCLPGTAAASSTAAAAPPAATTLATVTSAGSPSKVTAAPSDSSNPLAGKGFYANPYYSSEIVSLAAPSLSAAGSAALAAKATEVAKVGTFYWL